MLGAAPLAPVSSKLNGRIWRQQPRAIVYGKCGEHHAQGNRRVKQAWRSTLLCGCGIRRLHLHLHWPARLIGSRFPWCRINPSTARTL